MPKIRHFRRILEKIPLRMQCERKLRSQRQPVLLWSTLDLQKPGKAGLHVNATTTLATIQALRVTGSADLCPIEDCNP